MNRRIRAAYTGLAFGALLASDAESRPGAWQAVRRWGLLQAGTALRQQQRVARLLTTRLDPSLTPVERRTTLERIRSGPVNVLPQLLRALSPLHCSLPQRCIRFRHHVSERIDRNAPSILAKHSLKHPAMAMKVGELRVLKLAVQAT